MKKTMIVASCVLVVAVALASPTKTVPSTQGTFYVFTERGSRLNHYIPSGYMGDWDDVKMNPSWEKKPGEGKYCIKITYSAGRKQGAGWSGVYWQDPANSWGDKKGGYNLSGFTKLTFMARGEKGGESLDKIGMGGITGQTEDGDSDQASIEGIELTKDWKKYQIDLAGLDLSHIIGGFVWVANAESNPQGATFFLDEIRFEK